MISLFLLWERVLVSYKPEQTFSSHFFPALVFHDQFLYEQFYIPRMYNVFDTKIAWLKHQGCKKVWKKVPLRFNGHGNRTTTLYRLYQIYYATFKILARIRKVTKVSLATTKINQTFNCTFSHGHLHRVIFQIPGPVKLSENATCVYENFR